jgi:hypothetical protein
MSARFLVPSAAAAGHGLLPGVAPAASGRGRLRNGATPGDFLAAPRCGARTRRQGCCRQPAMSNGRCRLHGGLSTGPRTAAGRARCAAARRTHGFYAAETVALRRAAAAHCRRMNALLGSGRRRATAGHGVLPSRSTASPIGVHGRNAQHFCPPRSSAAQSPSTAGHGLHPSSSASASRQGFVQRCLMGSSALGLGLTVKPPATAGHGVLPSFSALPLNACARG